MNWDWLNPKPEPPARQPGFYLGDNYLGWPDSGLVFTGAPGSGKTYASRSIQRQAIQQQLSMMVACAKVDEADAIESLCRELGGLRQPQG